MKSREGGDVGVESTPGTGSSQPKGGGKGVLSIKTSVEGNDGGSGISSRGGAGNSAHTEAISSEKSALWPNDCGEADNVSSSLSEGATDAVQGLEGVN